MVWREGRLQEKFFWRTGLMFNIGVGNVSKKGWKKRRDCDSQRDYGSDAAVYLAWLKESFKLFELLFQPLANDGVKIINKTQRIWTYLTLQRLGGPFEPPPSPPSPYGFSKYIFSKERWKPWFFIFPENFIEIRSEDLKNFSVNISYFHRFSSIFWIFWN